MKMNLTKIWNKFMDIMGRIVGGCLIAIAMIMPITVLLMLVWITAELIRYIGG